MDHALDAVTPMRREPRKRKLRAAFYANLGACTECPDVRTQLDKLRHVAAARGWFVVAEYLDERMPKGGRGPALERLVKDAHVLACEVVACWHPGVLGRNSVEARELITELRENRVAFYSLRDGVGAAAGE